MPSFRYTAITASGETTTGLMEAPSEQALLEMLRRQGSLPMRAEPAEGKDGFLPSLMRAEFLGGGGKLSGQDVADATRELAVMLGAGQDLDRALRFLVDTTAKKHVRVILTQVRDAVRDGSPFAAALQQHPRSFPKLYVGLVRAGEAGGMLGPTLERLADLLEKQRALRTSVISSLIYPTILLVAGIGSIVLLLTQVLPQFVPADADRDRSGQFRNQLRAVRGRSVAGGGGCGATGLAASGSALVVGPDGAAPADYRQTGARGVGSPVRPHARHVVAEWRPARGGAGHCVGCDWQHGCRGRGAHGHRKCERRRWFVAADAAIGDFPDTYSVSVAAG
jgi:hypothetical protein